MPVRGWRRTTKSGLKRINLTARHVVNTFTANGRAGLKQYEEFPLNTCTIQPATGEELETLGEGYRDREGYNIWTATSANPAIEGTSSNPDEVFLDERFASNPGWFVVMNRKPWQNGHVVHYHLLVVRRNETQG